MTELPNSWVETNLSQVALWGSGGTPSRKNTHYFSGDIPWIKTGELGRKYVCNAEEHISEEAIKKSSAKIFPEGSVGIAMYGATIGKVSIWGIDASTNQACAVAQCHPKLIDNEFLYHFLFSQKRDFINAGKGGAQPNISQGLLKEWLILLPPLNEQKRIVAKIEELFSELDKSIKSLKTAQTQLNLYRQALLKHAFEGKLTKQWRKENKDKLETADELLKKITENGKNNSTFNPREKADLPEIPSQWLYTRLANVGDLGRGKSKHRPRNDKKLFGGKYPFLQTGEVKAANRVIKEYTKTYSDIGLQQSKLWPKGTLCITIAANIAETAFLGFDACFPDSVVGFAAREKLVLSEYVELFIRSVRTRIEAYAPATAQKNINLTTLENLVIPICSLDEQKQMVAQLEAIFSIIDDNENEIDTQLQKSEALRQSILKQAFSGRLVKQNPNDEPASVLLERIKAEKEGSKKKKRSAA